MLNADSLVYAVDSVKEEELRGRRVLMFAFGSGYTASMFSLFVSPTADLASVFGGTSSIDRLDQRVEMGCEEFLQTVDQFESCVDQGEIITELLSPIRQILAGVFKFPHF